MSNKTFAQKSVINKIISYTQISDDKLIVTY